MQIQKIKSVTSRQEVKPVKANITKEQHQTLTKLYNNLGIQQNKNVELDRNQQQKQIYTQPQNQTITPRNTTPQSCRTASELKYFLYQKSNLKKQGKMQNNLQVLPKTKNSLHRNFSQLEKSASALLTSLIQTTTTPQSKQKKYNLILKIFIKSICIINCILIKKEQQYQQEGQFKRLDDFITQVSRPTKQMISPFKQTKSLSPSTRVGSAKPKKQIYYKTSLVESFKNSFPKTPEQQLFKDHAVQTFNCVGFCMNLQESDKQIIQSKQLTLPPKLN